MLKVFISSQKYQSENQLNGEIANLSVLNEQSKFGMGLRLRKSANRVALQFFINQSHGLLFAYEHYEMLYCFRSEENYRLEINEPLKQM